MPTVNDIHELGTAFEQFKQHHKSVLEEVVSKTEVTTQDAIKKASEATLAKYDELKAANQKLETNIDQLATELRRTGNAYRDSTEEGQKANAELVAFNKARQDVWNGKSRAGFDPSKPVTQEELDAYKKAHEAVMRYGDSALNEPDVRKSMSVGVDPDGGAWIQPADRQAGIISRVFETSPVRQVARVITTNSHEVEFLMDPNRVSSGGWVSEKKPRTPTGTPEVDVRRITPGEIYANPSVTQIMLEDAGFDVEAFLADKVAESFSLDENAAFVNGDGVGKPRGFMTYGAGTLAGGLNKWGEIQQVGSGSSGAFTYTGFVNMITSFRGNKYYPNLKWLLQRGSVASLMLLQNAANQYIFQPVVNGAFNGTPFLGYEVVYASDMPAIGAGAKAAALGNWQMAYCIVDRVGISTIRDALTAKPFVQFYTRKRVGGDVLDFDALKIMVLS
jgi:HK97 family phage major capsid protein